MTQLDLLAQRSRELWVPTSDQGGDKILSKFSRPSAETGQRLQVVQVASPEVGSAPLDVSLLSIRMLVARGKLQQAQKLAALLPADRLPEALLAVLAPPIFRTTPSKTGTDAPDRAKDYQWIAESGREYAGRWVALHRGHLLADAASLSELAAAIDPALGRRVTPLFHRVESDAAR